MMSVKYELFMSRNAWVKNIKLKEGLDGEWELEIDP